MENKAIGFPEDHVIIGDDAFPLRPDLMKPFHHSTFERNLWKFCSLDSDSLSKIKIRRMKFLILFVILLTAVISKGDEERKCAKPVDEGGPCLGHIEMFFYDLKTKKCQTFFGGDAVEMITDSVQKKIVRQNAAKKSCMYALCQ
ncbi:hypothetical protein TNCV_1495761 [Trichonephila clavipes]|nr:hypothetical protein TNCV_1495761 [Trichonephila clavipes]